MTDEFTRGMVAALDVVAAYDHGVIWKTIVETGGSDTVLLEVCKNGSDKSKRLIKVEFPHWSPGKRFSELLKPIKELDREESHS